MTPLVIRSKPGVKRDGTRFEGEHYTDAQWCRFVAGLPRKMGGYRSLTNVEEIVRGITSYKRDSLLYVHVGSASKLQRFTFAPTSGDVTPVIDRTPGALVNSVDNMWRFVNYAPADLTTPTQLFAHVARTGFYMTDGNQGQIFSGNVTGTAALTPVTLPVNGSVSGGIANFYPFLVCYGNDGYFGWSAPGIPTDFAGAGSGGARITGQKIVHAMPTRAAGGQAPSGLIWSIDSVLRATFVGSSAGTFGFDTLSAESSLYSSNCIAEYDGSYFWAGVDRFLMYNGVVREIPNQLNLDYFFEGANPYLRQRVFAFKVPRYGEIWWCYGRRGDSEALHAVIYNVRENTWYDTKLPSYRSCGLFAQAFESPLMTGGDLDSAGKTKIWMHETGFDEIDGQAVRAIDSYFETADLSTLVSGKDRVLRVSVLEPDFVQRGTMTAQIRGRANAGAPEVDGEIREFGPPPRDPRAQLVMFKEARRELRFRFGSNVEGGDYRMGQPIAHVEEGEGRQTA